MIDLLKMWTKPKMVAYAVLTMTLYPLLIYPFQTFYLFAGHADYLRIGMGIPVAFSFLFGPAAAWGAAFGNLIYDFSTDGFRWISLFGFLGNFLVAYIPYKLWSAVTSEKPDLRSIQKTGLFLVITLFACSVCGLIIGWGLLYLYSAPFTMTVFTITVTDALWGIILGSAILAATYGLISRRSLLYTDILALTPKPSWTRTRSLAIIVYVMGLFACFAVAEIANISPFMLVPFVMVSIVSTVAACK
jgi:energy-coupling factor transport system substrate-specific component